MGLMVRCSQISGYVQYKSIYTSPRNIFTLFSEVVLFHSCNSSPSEEYYFKNFYFSRVASTEIICIAK